MNRETWATAYHEAGHAVAHFVLKRRIERVTIVPGDEVVWVAGKPGRSGGHLRGRVLPQDTAFLEYGSPTLRELKATEDAIVCGFAGAHAEHRHRRRWEHLGDSGDLEAVRGLAGGLADALRRGPKATKAYLTYCDAVAEELVEDDLNWSRITAVADALVDSRTLSGAAVRRVIRQATEEYMRERVRAHRLFGKT